MNLTTCMLLGTLLAPQGGGPARPNGTTLAGPSGPSSAGPNGPTTAGPKGPTTAGPKGPSTAGPAGPANALRDTPGPTGPRRTASAAPAEEELVLRMHDLSTLADPPEVGLEIPCSQLSPPYHMSMDADEYQQLSDMGDEGWVNVERVTNLVSEIFSREFEYEGRYIDVDDQGRMVVVGPPSLHEAIDRLLAFYRGSVGADLELEVTTLRLPPGSELPGTVVPQDQLGALLAAGGSSRRTFSVNLRGDGLGCLEATRAERLVVDYDVEIAQGAAIVDPITLLATSGVRGRFRAAAAQGGTHLAFVLQRPELESDGARRLGVGARLSSEGGTPSVSAEASLIHAYSALNRSMAGEVFLPDGHALVLRTSLHEESGRKDELVIVRRAAGHLPLRATLELTRPGERLEVLDLGAVSPPRIEARGYLAVPGVQVDRLATNKYVTVLGADLRDGYVDRFAELMHMVGTEQCQKEVSGRYAFVRPYGEEEGGGARAREEQDQVLALFESLQAPTRQYEVELLVRRDGRPVAEARTVVRDGGSTALALGRERLRVADYDVEVAQFASIPDPSTLTVFDGLCLWVAPRAEPDGSLSLDLRGGAHLVDRWITEDVGSHLYEGLDREEARQALTNGKRRVRPDANGVWTTWIGEKDGNEPVVWIRVRPL